ncbi:MAG: HPr kinase/phosphatase C-terminal domain-containing protein [Pseudomonadota bacterium]
MTGPLTLHASCVAVQGRGVLILGPSGAGKSGLALQLMGFGAQLVADDRTILRREGDGLLATCPPALAGMIEARGIGILNARPLAQAGVALVVDLGQPETDRLPPPRTITLLGLEVDLVLQSQNDHFAAAVLLYLAAGRRA